jgi:hypothetical protein
MINTSFLDHCGVLQTASLPLLTPLAQVLSKAVKTPRVPMFKYPIPPHSLAAWKLHLAVDSHSPTSLAFATANAILMSLGDGTNTLTPENTAGQHLGDRDSLATDLKNILGDAMNIATTMFPLKATTPCNGQTLPHHLWPKSVLHDIHAICNRTKAIRCLVTSMAATPDPEMETLIDAESPHHKL